MNQTYAPAWGSSEAAAAVKPKAVHLVLIGIGIFTLALVAAVLLTTEPVDKGSAGGSFYASAGWTAQRAADLKVSLYRDGGLSKAEADCVMKDIVGDTTWLEWRSIGSGGQLVAIRAAARSC